MDAELKANWIKALRSGDYKQGQGYLKNPKDDTYCCLGVLVEVAGEDFKKEIKFGQGAAFETYVPLTAKLGHDLSLQSKLISMNDVDGASFAEIADYLEGMNASRD